MKYQLTCNDVVRAMERETVTVNAECLEDAFEKAKAKFARKYKTKKSFVDITACRIGG